MEEEMAFKQAWRHKRNYMVSGVITYLGRLRFKFWNFHNEYTIWLHHHIHLGDEINTRIVLHSVHALTHD